MNPYFWLFSLYALWITPVSISTAIWLGREMGRCTQIRIAGLLIPRRKKKPQEKSNASVKRLFFLDFSTLLALIRKGYISRTIGTLKLDRLDLQMRISFADAACTAMSYAAVRAVLQTALSCLPWAEKLHGRVDMDFEGAGSQLFIRCMFSVRLGMLITAVLRLGLAVLRERAERMKTEEKPYAASH